MSTSPLELNFLHTWDSFDSVASTGLTSTVYSEAGRLSMHRLPQRYRIVLAKVRVRTGSNRNSEVRFGLGSVYEPEPGTWYLHGCEQVKSRLRAGSNQVPNSISLFFPRRPGKASRTLKLLILV